MPESMASVMKPGPSGCGEDCSADIRSGFMVFPIALPLLPAISLLCGLPVIGGVFTFVLAILMTPGRGNSKVKLMKPAADWIARARTELSMSSANGRSFCQPRL